MKQAGFSLIELLLAIVIAGILAGIALPSFDSTIANNRMSSAANTVVGAFNLARVEATKRGAAVNISSVSGSNNWGVNGFLVWLDVNADGDFFDTTANDFDAGEVIRLYEPVANGLTLSAAGTVESMRFSASGFVAPESTLCLSSNQASVQDRQLNLALSGRASITAIDC